MRRFLLTFPVLFLLVPVTARAVPPLINHEGLLLDEAGLPLEGNHTLTFTIHDAAQDGVALWTADVALQLLDGYYQVLLGLAPQGFPASLFDGSTRYLGLAIDHGAQLTPRRQLASVPYALQAKHAAVADNATGNITPSGINLSSGGSIAIDGATVVHTDRKITPSSLAIGATTVIDAGGKVLPSSIDVKAGGNIAIGGSEVIDSARRWRGAPIDAGNVVGRVGDASSFDGHPLSDFIVMTDPNGAKAKLSQLEVDADTLGSKAPAHYLSFQDAAHEAAADAPRQVLDWLKSIPAAGAPIPALDADLLDGKHGTDFLGATATAVNSDKLDGKHASAFLGFAEGMSDPAQQILAWLSSLNAPLAIDAHLLDGLHAADFLRVGATAANADKLDGLHAADFLDPVTLQALNADRLDNLDSSAFLLVGAKAADSDKLDGLHKEAFLLAGGNAVSATDADMLDGLHASSFLSASGKAVDADRLDTLDSSQFLRRDIDASMAGTLAVGQHLSITGNTALSGAVNVSGQLSAGGGLIVGGTLEANGGFKRGEMRYFTLSRTLDNHAGDWVNVGRFSNNGVGFFAKIYLYTHACSIITMQSFEFASDAYHLGDSATWIELPMNRASSQYGNTQAIAVDVYNADRSTTASTVQMRLRAKSGWCSPAPVTIIIETNVAFTESSAAGENGTVASGYLGNYQWLFPVSTPWNATTQGLFVTSNGNVGIGKTDPGAKLDIDGQLKVTNAVTIWTPTTVGSQTVRHLGVYSFNYPPQGYPAGQEWANRYYHIRTPDTRKNGQMYRYDLTGYSYGISRPISFTWVGYLYGGAGDSYHIWNSYAENNTSNGVPVTQYIGSDQRLYLKFGPMSQYCNWFVLDYSSGGEATVHNAGGYSTTLTNVDTQL